MSGLGLLDEVFQVAAQELGRSLGDALPALSEQVVLKIPDLAHATVDVPDVTKLMLGPRCFVEVKRFIYL